MQRKWCMYELYLTLSLQKEFRVAFSPTQYGQFMSGVIEGNADDGGDSAGFKSLKGLISALDIDRCEASDHDDVKLIDEWIANGHAELGIGATSAAEVNKEVQQALEGWLSEASGGRAGSESRV